MYLPGVKLILGIMCIWQAAAFGGMPMLHMHHSHSAIVNRLCLKSELLSRMKYGNRGSWFGSRMLPVL